MAVSLLSYVFRTEVAKSDEPNGFDEFLSQLASLAVDDLAGSACAVLKRSKRHTAAGQPHNPQHPETHVSGSPLSSQPAGRAGAKL